MRRLPSRPGQAGEAAAAPWPETMQRQALEFTRQWIVHRQGSPGELIARAGGASWLAGAAHSPGCSGGVARAKGFARGGPEISYLHSERRRGERGAGRGSRPQRGASILPG